MVGKEEFYDAMRATMQGVFVGVSSLASANPPLAPAQAAVATLERQMALAVGYSYPFARAAPACNMGRGENV